MIRVDPELIRQSLVYEPDELCLQVGEMPEPALLESLGDQGPIAGRWSVLAARPRMVFEAVGDNWRLEAPETILPNHPRKGRDSLDSLHKLLNSLGLGGLGVAVGDNNLPPFRGGMIGFLGYDVAPLMERLPRRLPRTSRIPDIRLALYDTFVSLDHERQSAHACGVDFLSEGPRATQRRVKRFVNDLTRRQSVRRENRLSNKLVSEFSRTDYLTTVERVLEYIRAGDIFQANLSQKFLAEFDQLDAFGLYWDLRQQSPAPFSAFMRWDDMAVASASPEWFYQIRGRNIITRPIKGTRTRGDTRAEDEALVTELRQSAKDRAELTMIIDLERNDLGRICEYGSVRVLDPYAIESFAQVHHLVATVVGRLRADVGPIEVLRALFPGGSITGAPKIRAMQIIDELERGRRGLYTGAIGYFSPAASAFNIAIRTLTIEGRTAAYQVGGGIVADSDPQAEYDETLHKGRGLRAVLEGRGARP